MRVTETINIKNIIGDKWPTNTKTLALVDFIRNGGKTTPVKVIKTDDGNFILRDGRHRVLAFKLLGIEEIEAKFSTEINQVKTESMARYALRNKEKIKAYYDTKTLTRIISSLDEYFSEAVNDEDIKPAENSQYPILMINDATHTCGVVVLRIISITYDVYKLAFQEFVN